MPQNETSVTQFVQTVLGQVRAKHMHTSIQNELLDHIEAQKAAYLEQGVQEGEATRLAVASMGDPVTIGRQLNQAHKPAIEWSLVGITAAIVVIGLTVQFALGNSPGRYAASAVVGVGALLLAYWLDCRRLSRRTVPIVCGVAAIAVLPFLLPSWLNVPFFNMGRVNGQYTHMAFFSLLFCPVMTLVIDRLRTKRVPGYLGCWAVYLVLSALCLGGPSLFGWGMLTVTFIFTLTTAIAKGWFPLRKPLAIAATFLPFALLLAALLLWMPSRLLSSLRPDLDPNGLGYMAMMCRQMIAGAKLFGANPAMTEIGNTLSVDYLFATVIARYGIVAALGMVAAFAALLWRMVVATCRHRTALGFLLSLCSTVAIAMQGILYILSNLGFNLPHGTLPLLSFGGAAYLANMMLIGLSMAAYRQATLMPIDANVAQEIRR
jgi:cell division protein FtsW (lipid II flippase)